MTEQRITQATAGELFDAVHFASHAGDDGIEMGGWIMHPEQVAQMANHVRAQVVFLNVCRSIFLPQYLIDQHIPAVIAHTKRDGVLDKTALQLASYFYAELTRQGGDFHKAYQRVSQRDGTLMWNSNGSYLGIYEPLVRRLEGVESTGQKQALWLKRVTYSIGVESALIIVYALLELIKSVG